MSRSSQNSTPETSPQIQADWVSATKNAFHNALIEVISSQDKPQYEYPSGLEFLRDVLSSEDVKEQITQFIRWEAGNFFERFKKGTEKSSKNPDKQHKPVKYLVWNLSLTIPFNENIYTEVLSRSVRSDMALALLSLYPVLDDFFPKTKIPYTYITVLDVSNSFDLEKRDNVWVKRSVRGTNESVRGTNEQDSPGSIEFSVSTRKVITPEDIAFVESQLALQKK